ncbi:MAG: hypothetical protein A3H49_02075 [Nitrospirae bacterium RIFCSPLOWO2_02_FULL_62_14]|nr:MAG: hypothetical protein A3H49_02075 [Nitrospirae bacterium RIFCSPLOWO2_02_FULL_62_14]OGW66887.1 MAG: hypothetical protein A3A88_10560 [Nitrospirae bacterium RIFCSPLOWO2_01_FULL_62_17]
MEAEDNVLEGLLDEIRNLMRRFPQALEQRSAEIAASGKDPELAGKLRGGADAMKDSGNIYVSWAKHYVSLASGNTDATSDEDETEDFDV